MGSTSFLLPTPVPPAAAAVLDRACFAGGFDQTPMPTRVKLRGNKLTLSKGTSESGYLLVPWPIGDGGAIVTTTATILERWEQYSLTVELARGKLGQVRGQAAEWRELGLRIPDEFDSELVAATHLFAAAVQAQPSAEAHATAEQVLRESHRLSDRLLGMYTLQVFDTRLVETGARPDTRFAARFSSPPDPSLVDEYRRTFNAAQVAIRWRDVEPAEAEYDWSVPDRAVRMAKDAGLPVTVGPVIDIAPGMMPAWAAGWSGDFPTVAAFMCEYLETVLARYRKDVRRYVVCGGFNHADNLELSDDDRLRLAARLFEAAHRVDPSLELVLSLAQPWGDYLTNDEQTISPLAFADDLLRAGVGFQAIEVEVRNGVLPRGSLPRDLLDTCRLIDLFYKQFALPLEIVLSHPAGGGEDLRAEDHKQALWLHAWEAGPGPDVQAVWGAGFAALALCKPQVRALTWDHWSDTDPHLTPNGGLVDTHGRPRPLLARLRALRAAHLL
jgi:hypothetical protein